MTGEGTVTKLTNLAQIEGADRIKQAIVLGETVIVGSDLAEGTLGVLFDMETQLSPSFLSENNLYSNAELNKDPNVKGYFDRNGRVRPIRLRGVKCSAFFIPIDSLDYLGMQWQENAVVGKIGESWVARKYVPEQKHIPGQKKAKMSVHCAMFKEHFDTDHLIRNLHQIPEGLAIITKKLHGTSARYGKLQVERPLLWWENLLAKFVEYKPTVWRNVVGSRTVTKSIEGLYEDSGKGYYDTDLWSAVSRQAFGDRLHKGETVYFEIVGYQGTDKTIMPSHSTQGLAKFLDKEDYTAVREKYGDVVQYVYGMLPGNQDVYVYRITHTTVDGDSFDLTWEQVKQRCAQLGVKHVPEVCAVFSENDGTTRQFCFPNNEQYDTRSVAEKFEQLALNADHEGTHAEGICYRIDNYPQARIFKHKNVRFKFMEHGEKDSGIVNLEEQEVTAI